MHDFKQIMLERLHALFSAEELRRWFEPLAWDYSPDEGRLNLTAPTLFHRKKIAAYAPVLAELAASSGRAVNQLKIHSLSDANREVGGPVQIHLAPVELGQGHRPLNRDYTFKRFITGPGNQLAYMALTDFSADPASLGGSGLLLISPGPWGKTHLLEAVARRLADDGRPYFKLDLPDAHPAEALGAFWRGQMAVIVDDIHLLAGRPDLQQRLIQAYDEAGDSGPALICSVHSAPHQLPGLSEALRSRLGGGLTLSLESPEYEMLLEMAVRRAVELGLEPPPESMAQVVRAADRDPRRLAGFIDTAAFISRRLGMTAAEALLRACPVSAAESQAGRPDIATILEGVAGAFGLKVSDLTGHSKLRQAAWPRRVAMLLAREMTDMTTTEIGRALGGRDHSTVIHALKKIRAELKNPAQVKLVENIKRSVAAS